MAEFPIFSKYGWRNKVLLFSLGGNLQNILISRRKISTKYYSLRIFRPKWIERSWRYTGRGRSSRCCWWERSERNALINSLTYSFASSFQKYLFSKLTVHLIIYVVLYLDNIEINIGDIILKIILKFFWFEQNLWNSKNLKQTFNVKLIMRAY